MYLEGAVAILKERSTLDFHGLCCGKISLEDMKRLGAMKKLKKEQIKIPPFMRDMDQYMAALDIIARVNHIDEYVEEQKHKENNSVPASQAVASGSIVPAGGGNEDLADDEQIIPVSDSDD